MSTDINPGAARRFDDVRDQLDRIEAKCTRIEALVRELLAHQAAEVSA
jgi:hypothetical protein